MLITSGDVNEFLKIARKMAIDNRFDIWEVGKAAGYDQEVTHAISDRLDDMGKTRSTNTSGGAILL